MDDSLITIKHVNTYNRMVAAGAADPLLCRFDQSILYSQDDGKQVYFMCPTCGEKTYPGYSISDHILKTIRLLYPQVN